MSTNIRSAVVGIFRDQRLADQAVADLENAGFTHDQIHYAGAGSAGSFLKSLFTGQDATSGSLSKDLTDMGLSDEEVQYYIDEYKNGNPVIAVQAPGREQEARTILQRSGAYDYAMTHGSAGPMSSPQQPPANMPTGTPDTNRNMPPPNMQSQPPQPPPTVQTPPATAGQRVRQEEQKVADETTRPMPNPTSTQPPPQTGTTPVAQQTTIPNDPQAQLQALQAQYQQIQQQLRDAQAQLQAAKHREAQMQASRQQEMQMHNLQKQLQEAQMQLHSTMAELQATEARIAAQYNQSQQ